MSEEVKCWPLSIHDPLPKWKYGKVVLIGDAAHPVSVLTRFLRYYAERNSFAQMLPFGGQGSNQAIEDGGALGYLLQGVEKAEEISSRLELFEKVRRNRASRVQTLSKVRIGREKEVEQELKRYVDTVNSGKPPFVSRATW